MSSGNNFIERVHRELGTLENEQATLNLSIPPDKFSQLLRRYDSEVWGYAVADTVSFLLITPADLLAHMYSPYIDGILDFLANQNRIPRCQLEKLLYFDFRNRLVQAFSETSQPLEEECLALRLPEILGSRSSFELVPLAISRVLAQTKAYNPGHES